MATRTGCGPTSWWLKPATCRTLLRCPFVPKPKRDREWVSSRAKAAAIEAAGRRKNRKRLGAALGLGVLVIAIVGAAAFAGGGSKSPTTTTVNPGASLVSSTTTTEAALPSAAGKPCVAVTDPLPAGAPNVPVKVGPQPTHLDK